LQRSSNVTLSPRDWLLLLLLTGATESIDRVRIQKAMFLFAERSKAPASEKYSFEPYHYGPFSFGIYPDLATLQREGLIQAEVAGWTRSPSYTLTRAGVERAAAIKRGIPPPRLELLGQLRGWVTQRSFSQLLRDIYRLYPEYATKSIFRY
jgi:DNA-binding PadR family transcriptional regulator